MKNFVFALVLILYFSYQSLLLAVPVGTQEGKVNAQSQKAWDYIRGSRGGEIRGLLKVLQKGEMTFVSAKEFCKVLKCKLIYQWAQERLVIQNSQHKLSAILSARSKQVLIDSRVMSIKEVIQSEISTGYLLSINLAAQIASNLKLGQIVTSDTPINAKLNSSLVDSQSIKSIVIDPGHGGYDLGTQFKSEKLFEKDIALKYAMSLQDELRKQDPDIKVYLTRDADKYVSLSERASYANTKKADIFLSLHVNHSPNAESEGSETFILSLDASDDSSRKTALLENDSWLKEVKNNDVNSNVIKIIADMESTQYIQKSAVMAAFIQQELAHLDYVNSTQNHSLKNRGVKQAMFYVLSRVAMPSVLVEIGFLSNKKDRKLLMSVDFREEFAKSLVKAIKRYKK